MPDVTTSHAVPPAAAVAKTYSAAAKGVATTRRHKRERRTDALDHIRAQIADGTLVVRQMGAAEHKAALETARCALRRIEAAS
jgi:hypothetical protein